MSSPDTEGPELPEGSATVYTRGGGRAVVTPDSSGEEVNAELRRTDRSGDQQE